MWHTQQVRNHKKYYPVHAFDAELEFQRICGKVDAIQAFVYFFRRFGLSGIASDDYKDLIRYSFTTPDDDILLTIRLGYYDCHTIAVYAEESVQQRALEELHAPIWAWHEGFDHWCWETHQYRVYEQFWQLNKNPETFGPIVFQELKAWIPTSELEEETKRLCLSENEEPSQALMKDIMEKFYVYKREQNQRYREEYTAIVPFPLMAYDYDQVEERIQQEYERWNDAPDGSALKRVGNAVEATFQDFLFPTYIQDVELNIRGYCRGENAIRFSDKKLEEMSYSNMAGYAFPIEWFDDPELYTTLYTTIREFGQGDMKRGLERALIRLKEDD